MLSDANLLLSEIETLNEVIIEKDKEISDLKGQILKESSQKFKSKNDDLISIVFEGTAFIMSIKKEGKLIICNSFEYQNEEDLIYFILSHHKQLGLIEKNIINLMSYLEDINSEKILSLISHFKELKEYTVNFLDKSAYNSTLTCE